MPKCYLVSLRLPNMGMLDHGLFTPVGTLFDQRDRSMADALPHIEVVAKRSFHRIQAQMDDPITMESEFHKFVYANKNERRKYGDRLVGFFPVTPHHRPVGRSQTDDRMHGIQSYLVYDIEDNHLID